VNVIVLIEGREAIPVRAIPWLTNWRVMGPNEIAAALEHEDDEAHEGFYELRAYHRQDGTTALVDKDCWRHLRKRLKVLANKIYAAELSSEDDPQRWRDESLLLLPAGVFVWKDDYVMCYEKGYDPHDSLEKYQEGSFKEYSTSSTTEEESAFDLTLNFNPSLSENETAMVTEGFEPQKNDAKPQAAPAQPADAVPAPAETLELATGGTAAVANAPAATVAPVEGIEAAATLHAALVVEVPASEPVLSVEFVPESLKTVPTTKKRESDLVSKVIEAAQRQSDDPTNANLVWLILVDKVEKKEKPFFGKTEEGLQWIDSNDKEQYLSMKNLRDRIARQHKKAPRRIVKPKQKARKDSLSIAK